MANSLEVGQSSLAIRMKWGEPDLINDVGDKGEVWSYAQRANSNDIVATLMYTSAKEGDTGTFLDLEFENGKLKSWREAEHTMPPKQGANFGYSVGTPQIPGNSGISPIPGMSHY